MAYLVGEFSTISFSTDGSNFTPIPSAVDITGPTMSRESVSTTHLGSPVRTFRGNRIADMGSCTFAYWYDPDSTDQQAVRDMLAEDYTSDPYWRIEDPDTSHTITFQGFLTKHDLTQISDGENWKVECEVKCAAGVDFA